MWLNQYFDWVYFSKLSISRNIISRPWLDPLSGGTMFSETFSSNRLAYFPMFNYKDHGPIYVAEPVDLHTIVVSPTCGNKSPFKSYRWKLRLNSLILGVYIRIHHPSGWAYLVCATLWTVMLLRCFLEGSIKYNWFPESISIFMNHFSSFQLDWRRITIFGHWTTNRICALQVIGCYIIICWSRVSTADWSHSLTKWSLLLLGNQAVKSHTCCCTELCVQNLTSH